MAYTYVWPTSLPQNPQKGFTETGGNIVLRTPTDMGPAKMRYRGLSPSTMSLTFLMTSAQVLILENFTKNTTKGVARFGFPHPRLHSVVETRIIPQGSGNFYTLTYAAPEYWTVAMQMEVLP